MEDKYVIGIGVTVIIVVSLILYFYPSMEIIREVEVCDEVMIATLNANPTLCRSGCVEFKGEFVPYNTLVFLQEELCNNELAIDVVVEGTK